MSEEKFDVILADPPWRYEHPISKSRAIENHYPTMSLDEIKEFRIPAEDNAVLFLWCPVPILAKGIEVIDAWGFVYRTAMVWVKDRIGMGYYVRSRAELLLIAVKGKPQVPLPKNRPDSIINAPRKKHSAKPVILYRIIEEMYPNARYIELFARNKREDWAALGNEVPTSTQQKIIKSLGDGI